MRILFTLLAFLLIGTVTANERELQTLQKDAQVHTVLELLQSSTYKINIPAFDKQNKMFEDEYGTKLNLRVFLSVKGKVATLHVRNDLDKTRNVDMGPADVIEKNGEIFLTQKGKPDMIYAKITKKDGKLLYHEYTLGSDGKAKLSGDVFKLTAEKLK